MILKGWSVSNEIIEKLEKLVNEKYGESLFEEEGLISGIKKEFEEFLKNRLADIFQEFYEELLGTDGL